MKLPLLTESLRREIIEAQANYILAKAELDKVELIEHENKTKVLASNILTDDDGIRILEARADFRLNEKDFNTFLQLVFEENKKAGLPVTDPNEAIDWKYKEAEMKARQALYKVQLKTVPEEMKEQIEKVQNSFKHRDKALDLILRLEV